MLLDRWKASSKQPRQDPALLRDSLWMGAGQVLAVVAQAAYFILVARLLGSTEYGVFVGAAACVAMVSQYGSLGSGLVFMRHVAPDSAKFRAYWGNVLLCTCAFGVVMAGIALLAAPRFLHNTDIRVLIMVALSECIFGQLTTTAGQVMQTFQKLRFTALINTLTNTARMLLALAMLLTLHRTNARTWACASLSVSVLAAAGGLIAITVCFGKPQFRLRVFKERIREGMVFAVSGSTTSIYNDADKAFLAHYGLSAANGIYTMAYRVIDIATMPIRSVHAAAFPRFFKVGAGRKGLSSTVTLAQWLLRRTSVLGIAAAAVAFTTAPLIPMIVGESFRPSVAAMRWLALIPLFRSFHLSAGDALAGAGKQVYRFGFQLGAAGLNVFLDVLLIPRFSWRGAAWASLATDGLLGLSLWCLVSYLVRSMREEDESVALGMETAEALA